MITNLSQLQPFDDTGALRVVVETPRGASVKIGYADGIFHVTRALPIGQCYAYDWGFVPGTVASDGDPVDAICLHDASTYPGVVLTCRAIGVVRVEQDDKDGARISNDRIIAVPTWNRRMAEVAELSQLPTHLRAEIEQFFHTVTLFTPKHVRITGWGDSAEAEALVRQSFTSNR